MPTLLGILGAVLLVCFVYPSAGMWLFGLLTLASLAFIFSKNEPDEPDDVIKRMKKYPKRKIYFSIPLILFIGFTMWNYSDTYKSFEKTKSSNSYNSSSNSDYTNKLRKAAEDLYDKCQIYGKSYDSRC